MRRGGWAVHMAPALGGSFEESPPSLTEYAARDRRWCQGNLQHAGVLPARGLHWVEPAASADRHRLLHRGAAVAPVPAHRHPDLVAGAVHPAGIFPEDLHALSAMAGAGSGARRLRVRRHDGTAARARSSSAIWRCWPTARRGAASAARSARSSACSPRSLISGLIAPVMMLIQSSSVAGILMGRDSGWNAQRRDDGSLPLRDVARRYGWHTAFGLSAGARRLRGLVLAVRLDDAGDRSGCCWRSRWRNGARARRPGARLRAHEAAARAGGKPRRRTFLMRANALVETFAQRGPGAGALRAAVRRSGARWRRIARCCRRRRRAQARRDRRRAGDRPRQARRLRDPHRGRRDADARGEDGGAVAMRAASTGSRARRAHWH